MTDERITYALKVLMVVVLAFYTGEFILGFLERIRAVVYIVIGAIFFAYLIYPIVQRLRRRMPLVWAIVLVYAVIGVLLAVAALFIVPRVGEDAALLVRHYPDIQTRLTGLLYDPHDPLTSRLPDWARNELGRIPSELAGWVRLHGLQTFGHVIFVLAGTAAAIATFIIVPLLTAYLLLDLDHLQSAFSSIVPQQRRRAAGELFDAIETVIGGFIRGQLLVALTVGVLITIVLLILHVPYAFLFGLLAAVGDLIPYVGAILAFLPAFTSAWLSNGFVNALIVAAAFVAIFQAEGHFIAPNVVSKTVKLSPFVVLLALLIGGELAGLFGLLIAVPVAGVLRVLALRVFGRPGANQAQP